MNICECITVNAKLFPNRIALVFRGQSWTYRELDEASYSAAQVLVDKGVKAGDRVSIQIGNCPAFPVWYYAVLRLGAIAVSLSTRLSQSETEFILNDSQSCLLISSLSSEFEPPLPQAVLKVSADGKKMNGELLDLMSPVEDPFAAEPDQPALILYTSGTTGFPKGATLSHLNVRSNVAAFNHLCQMKSDDRILLAVPLFHCFGQNALLNSVLNVGGTLVLQERFDLNETRELIRQHQVTQLYGVPMMFQLLLASCDKDELGTVSYCFSAAAPLAIQTSEQWLKKFGQPIYEGYGLTETSPFASYNHRNCYRAGSIGMPIDSVEMNVVDVDTGSPVGPHEPGEITIRGPNVMLGYWNQPDETELAIRNGWFHSGDIGMRDEAGYFYIVDRVKDMISVGGMKVFPAEVERVLRDQPAVQDAAVVGIEEPMLGEQVIGFVVLDSADDAFATEKLAEQIKAELADYKMPRRLLVVDELPRNSSGKVLKTKLRELASESLQTAGDATRLPLSFDGSPDATGASESSETKELAQQNSPAKILVPGLLNRLTQKHPSEHRSIVVDALSELVIELSGNSDSPDPDRTFLELGMDSLSFVELGTQLQLEIETMEPLPATLLFDYPTINDLADYVFADLLREESESTTEKLGESNLRGAGQDGSRQSHLVQQVHELSEEEALEQLMKELE